MEMSCTSAPQHAHVAAAAAVVWFHGLGDARVGYWGRRFASASSALPPFHEPRAPLGRAPARAAAVVKKKQKKTQEIEHDDDDKIDDDDDDDDEAMVPSWFDVPALPVTVHSSGDSHPGSGRDGASDAGVGGPPVGLAASVEMAHGLAAALERDHGIPPEKIIFGGFSQGAALAIEAGTTYGKPCAGIVSISGWWPRRRSANGGGGGGGGGSSGNDSVDGSRGGEKTREKTREKTQQQRVHRIPVFFSSGTSDPEVLYAEAKASCAALTEATPGTARPFLLHACDVTCEKVQRGRHMPTRAELDRAVQWMVERIQP
jgi:predicted esterase